MEKESGQPAVPIYSFYNAWWTEAHVSEQLSL